MINKKLFILSISTFFIFSYLQCEITVEQSQNVEKLLKKIQQIQDYKKAIMQNHTQEKKIAISKIESSMGFIAWITGKPLYYIGHSLVFTSETLEKYVKLDQLEHELHKRLEEIREQKIYIMNKKLLNRNFLINSN